MSFDKKQMFVQWSWGNKKVAFQKKLNIYNISSLLVWNYKRFPSTKAFILWNLIRHKKKLSDLIQTLNTSRDNNC